MVCILVYSPAGAQPASIKFEPYALPQTGGVSSHSPLFSRSKVDTPPSVRVHHEEDSGHTHHHHQPQAVPQGSYSPKEEYVT